MAKKKNPIIVLSEVDRDIIQDAINAERDKQRAEALKAAKSALKSGSIESAREELEVVAALDAEEPIYLADLPIDWKEPEAVG